MRTSARTSMGECSGRRREMVVVVTRLVEDEGMEVKEFSVCRNWDGDEFVRILKGFVLGWTCEHYQKI
jgi:hypothetical protein